MWYPQWPVQQRLVSVPFWFFHGADDLAVPHLIVAYQSQDPAAATQMPAARAMAPWSCWNKLRRDDLYGGCAL